MNILLVIAVGAVLLFIASRTYPFWIAKVFRLNDDTPPPSEALADGSDYVKSPTGVVFAHHFASIAGAGPIVGPIIALVFGWAWGWLWIIFGGIFYGAVQDMSSMCVSLREGGKTIAEIARRTLGTSGYLLFLAFLLIVISVVNAIFLNLSAGALSSSYPLEALGLGADQTLLATLVKDGVVHGRIGGIATTSVIVMTIAAPFLGLLVRRGLRGPVIYAIAAAVCVAGVLLGFRWPVAMSGDTWRWVLSGYVFVACWIPVWIILQPRDFMNVQILYAGLALLFVAAIVAGIGGDTMAMPANAIGSDAARARGPFWPIMFITIACGAISGFHSLVATGTTVKQIPRETDCRRVGYNAMLLESFLALLVLVAVASQLGSAGYTQQMASAGGVIQTFAVACGTLFTKLGIPMAIGSVLGILIIEGFLVTTLDTSIRLARYLLEELWQCLGRGNAPAILRTPLVNTALAVGLMLLFACVEDLYQALWPFFGAGNQLIGALALTTVSVWLLRRGRPIWFAAVPAVFMVITATAALGWIVWQQIEAGAAPIIVGAGSILIALAVGFVLVSLWRVRSAIRDAVDAPAR